MAEKFTVDMSAELRESMRQAATQREEIASVARQYGISQTLVALYAEAYTNWREVLHMNLQQGVVL